MQNQQTTTTTVKQIGCIGAGYVGATTMAVIAEKWPEIKIIVYDTNVARIAAWNSSNLPIYEPELDAMVQKCKNINLFFTTEYDSMVQQSDIIFVCVNTPTKEYGSGKGRAADLTFIELCARQLSKTVTSTSKIIVEKSTVPVRTSLLLKEILSTNTTCKFEILSNPEFLAEGTAISDLLHPDRVLIGGEPSAAQVLATIYERWVPANKIITTGLWSAELSKLVANCFLAQRISSINAISALCEVTGADVGEIAKSVGADKRIGPYFLNASVGFGGSCFQKDILNLCYLAEHFGLKQVSDYFYAIVELNNFQRARFVNKIVHSMFNTVCMKKIVILGFAFKKNTSDTRESSAITVCKGLLEECAHLYIYDPKVSETQIMHDLKGCDTTNVHLVKSVTEAANNAHALVILTEWDEFKTIDYTAIYNSMQKPAFLFDGRKILDKGQIEAIGFKVYSIGTADTASQW